ncbi:MAG: hypothetical protein J5696_04510 [Lachnospiraceae bacterium]|nr:hypothetical protein [Lachnospiraceae bacterium]
MDRQIRWDRLDNTGYLFPSIAGENMTSTYRISITLSEEIDRDTLQEALDILLPRIDLFNVRLRMGFFWYYFEENGKPAPRVTEEKLPCRFIRANRNHSYLFRVTYFGCRINLEVFHALTDGMGGINFIRELAYQYLRLSHPDEFSSDALSSDTSLNREDSFVRNYKKAKPKGFIAKKAFQIKGKHLPDGRLGLMHLTMSVQDLKKVTHDKGVSINEYMVALTAYAIYKNGFRGRSKGRPIRVAVPVNLRPYFDSYTTKNFFVVVSAEISDKEEEYSFDEILDICKTTLREQINKEHLEDLFSYSVSNQMNPFLKPIPLGIKNLAIRFVYTKSATANTTTLTNIGNIKIHDEYRKYVKGFYANIAMSIGQDIKGTVLSYGDDFVYTVSTILEDTSIERTLVKQLTSDGIKVSVTTNGVFYG